jgi:hypothetical protein
MLGCLATVNAFEDLTFINAPSPQSIGITVLETCLLFGRQAINEWILCNTVYRLFSIFFSLHSITARRSIILCSINYYTILLTEMCGLLGNYMTPCNYPEDHRFHQHCGKSLKSYYWLFRGAWEIVLSQCILPWKCIGSIEMKLHLF